MTSEVTQENIRYVMPAQMSVDVLAPILGEAMVARGHRELQGRDRPGLCSALHPFSLGSSRQGRMAWILCDKIIRGAPRLETG